MAANPEGWKSTPDNPLLWVWFVVYSIIPLALAVMQARFLFGSVGFGQDADDLADTLDQSAVYAWAGALSSIAGAPSSGSCSRRQLTERHVSLTGER